MCWKQKYDWVRVYLSQHNGLRPGNALWVPLGEEAMTDNSQQGADVRSRGECAKMQNGSWWREGMWYSEEIAFSAVFFFIIIRRIFPLPQVLKFIITKPSSLTSIPPECRQAFILILIKASGTTFHRQPCRPLSPSGEAVKLFIITYQMGEGHGCTALEWNLGRTLGDRRAELDNQ